MIKIDFKKKRLIIGSHTIQLIDNVIIYMEIDKQGRPYAHKALVNPLVIFDDKYGYNISCYKPDELQIKKLGEEDE